jgi:hypothetical protein
MRASSKIILFGLAISLTVLASCIKEVNYPPEPVIEFNQFGVYRSVDDFDSIGQLTISYTDGDGDIGLYDYDTVEPYKYNFFLDFMYMKNGQWVQLLPADTSLGFNARIPILTPNGKNKNIKGNISIDIQLFYAWALLGSDTIRFDVYIKDRALHSSNTVRTPAFIIQKP